MLEWSCMLGNNNPMSTRAINCVDKHTLSQLFSSTSTWSVFAVAQISWT